MKTECPSCEDPLFWQWVFRDELTASETLAQHRLRVKSGTPLADALWAGAWALREKVYRTVETAQRGGRLLTLFVEGDPPPGPFW